MFALQVFQAPPPVSGNWHGRYNLVINDVHEELDHLFVVQMLVEFARLLEDQVLRLVLTHRLSSRVCVAALHHRSAVLQELLQKVMQLLGRLQVVHYFVNVSEGDALLSAELQQGLALLMIFRGFLASFQLFCSFLVLLLF